MTNIDELLRQAELRADILAIANDLANDSHYTKEEAVQDLLQLLEKHNL